MRTKVSKTLGDRMILLAVRGSALCEVDGIALVDFRKKGDSFQKTMEQSLALLRDHAPRLYRRVVRQVKWIINQVTIVSMGIDYNPRIRACIVEFSEIPGVDSDARAAAYACFLVFAATEGVLVSRGVRNEAGFWEHVGRICLRESKAFASELASMDPMRYGTDLLLSVLDGPAWEWPDRKSLLSYLPRVWRDKRAPDAPNGAPPHR